MDAVNHPAHYNRPGQKECIVQMEEKFGIEATSWFCLLNWFKYIYRYQHCEECHFQWLKRCTQHS